MFHKIKNVFPLPEYKLSIQFSEGITKLYDIKPLFETMPSFRTLKNSSELFAGVQVDTGGYGIVWNDELDLSCDELWENGKTVKTQSGVIIARLYLLQPVGKRINEVECLDGLHILQRFLMKCRHFAVDGAHFLAEDTHF